MRADDVMRGSTCSIRSQVALIASASFAVSSRFSLGVEGIVKSSGGTAIEFVMARPAWDDAHRGRQSLGRICQGAALLLIVLVISVTVSHRKGAASKEEHTPPRFRDYAPSHGAPVGRAACVLKINGRQPRDRHVTLHGSLRRQTQHRMKVRRVSHPSLHKESR